ncbi:hypothetical protein DFH28DRAFT_932581 [Melampsora americana]|nr:hypothetical protein DFH28DRAFT_932581 [Melampsora americana]
MTLSMNLNGIMRVGLKVKTPENSKSILQIHSAKAWVNRGNLGGIEMSIAARKYDRPLEEGAYYRFDGPVIFREETGEIIFFPVENNSINVGTGTIRPMSLANKLIVNGRGVITQLVHQHKEDKIRQCLIITALHRHCDPTTGRMQKFSTDYTIDAIMLLSVEHEMFMIGRCFDFKGNVSGYWKSEKRFIVTWYREAAARDMEYNASNGNVPSSPRRGCCTTLYLSWFYDVEGLLLYCFP